MRQEVENFIIQQFGILQNQYGFDAPEIRRNSWTTRIDFKKGDIAIELEIDWREFEVFLLIVRLESGEMPKGYYMSGGKKCRLHFLTLARKRGWPIHKSPHAQPRTGMSSARNREINYLKSRITDYLDMLLSCIDLLLVEGRKLFDE